MRRNTHIHVEFLYRWLPAPVGRALSTCVDVVRIAFFGYATWLTIQLMPKMQNLQMTIVDLPMNYIYGVVRVRVRDGGVPLGAGRRRTGGRAAACSSAPASRRPEMSALRYCDRAAGAAEALERAGTERR